MNGQPHFFFDNNLSPDLAAGMKAFGESVSHISELYPDGDPGDVVWLEEIGRRGWFLVTRDRAIRRHPAEVRAYREHGVGGFVLSGKERSRCDLIRQLVRAWAQIKQKAESTHRPFLYRIPPGGGMLERLPL